MAENFTLDLLLPLTQVWVILLRRCRNKSVKLNQVLDTVKRAMLLFELIDLLVLILQVNSDLLGLDLGHGVAVSQMAIEALTP